jgi:hypothetical protein
MLAGAIYFGVALVGAVQLGRDPAMPLLCTLLWAWGAGCLHAEHRAKRKARQKRSGTET